MKKTLFQDLNEIKEFIIWAKNQGIQQLKVGEIEATFSVYEMGKQALPSDLRSDLENLESPEVTNIRAQNMRDSTEQNEDEDLKFWSSN